MFCGVTLFYSDDIIKLITPKEQIKSKYHKLLQNIKQKVSTKSKKEIITFIEKNSKKYNIFIKNFDIKNNTFILELTGNYKDLLNLLCFYQLHLHINKLDIQKDSTAMKALVYIDTKYFLNQKYIYTDKQNTPNPFIKSKAKHRNKHNKNMSSLKLNILAIINNEVLINGNWYKQNNIIDGYKILKINKCNIEIQNIISKKNKTIWIKNG
jgi:HSP90 family molecular chaperone